MKMVHAAKTLDEKVDAVLDIFLDDWRDECEADAQTFIKGYNLNKPNLAIEDAQFWHQSHQLSIHHLIDDLIADILAKKKKQEIVETWQDLLMTIWQYADRREVLKALKERLDRA